MTLTLGPAADFGAGRLAGLFSAAYEDYAVPFAVDERTFRFMVEAYDLDLDASRVALLDGVPVGLANLGLRGERAWIGGIGVTPFARRRGIAERLMRAVMDEARLRGARVLQLEVLVGNDAALALYEKLGFDDVRAVDVWVLDGNAAAPAGAADIELDAAQERIRSLRHAREPWQRDDETLARLRALDPPLHARAVYGGAAIVRASAGAASVVQIAGDEAAVRVLLETLRHDGSVNVLNLPEGEPAAEAFRLLGGRVAASQRELALDLS